MNIIQGSEARINCFVSSVSCTLRKLYLKYDYLDLEFTHNLCFHDTG